MTVVQAFIILVDDDVDFLDIHRRILEGAGHRVTCFARQSEAWDLMALEKPDLLILDLMMESLTAGFSFSKRVKEDPRFKGLPVLLLTGIESARGYDFRPKDADDLQAMSVDAFLTKPVDPKVLVAKVAGLLGGGEGDTP